MSEDPPPYNERQILIETWKEQARRHWKEFRPSLYRDLIKNGRLDEALTDAAERTYREMTELQKMGYQEHEAWEVVRESYLFTPEEGTTLSHSDSPFWKDRL